MKTIVLVIVCLQLIYIANAVPLPLNEYFYSNGRDYIKKLDKTSQNIDSLSDKEKVVNSYLEILKEEEFGYTSKFFYPSNPIENELINITSRPLYKHLKTLPKGGNLHIHEFQMLDRKVFLEMVKNSREYDYLYICDQKPDCVNKNRLYALTYFGKLPDSGWTKVKDSNWTIDDIVEKTTLTGILRSQNPPISPTDPSTRWQISNAGVFGYYSDLTKNNNTRFLYMKAILDSSLAENVQLLELRRSNFGTLYYFTNDGTVVYMNTTEEIESLIQFKKQYISSNPSFIDFIFLIYGTRSSNKNAILNDIINALNWQRKYPQLIRGYDLVGEEDNGHTLLFHSDSLIQAFNNTKTSNGTFNLFFHTAETNWAEDQLPSQYGDGVATLNNIYDALILNTTRIGHGLGFIKHPALYPTLIERQIAIEICPASNQILGYVADLRNHPGINYHRSGIPIVLAGDDPGSFGYNELTVDYYLAFMGWGFNLADLKQVSRNSIQYSSIPQDIKTSQAFPKWQTAWNKYINQTYELACSNSFTSQVNISNILPSYGPANISTNITVFGFGFKSLICKKITCNFGKYSTTGSYNHASQISCPTPIITESYLNVSLTLTISQTEYQTYKYYTFLDMGSSSGTTKTTPTTQYNFSPASKANSLFFFSFISFIVLILSS